MTSWTRAAQRTASLLSVLASLLVASGAAAQARSLASPRVPAADSLVSADVYVSTSAPLSIGVGARATFAELLILGVSLGGTPNAYADGLAGIPTAFGAPAGYGDLISRFFGGAFSTRLEGGFRLSRDIGIEVLVHYTALFASTEISASTVETFAGQAIPGLTNVGLSGVLHGVGGELAWSVVPIEGLFLRLSLGFTYFAAGAMNISVSQAMRDATPLVHQAESEMTRMITRYGVVPTGGLSVGWHIE